MFEIKELKHRYKEDMPDKKEAYIFYTTGMVTVEGDEFYVMVDDNKQHLGIFQSKDTFFNKLIRKIHEATKSNT
jgi:hypothetical protein